MIIAILGKSNSGKTTFAEYLKKKFGLDTVVTCTTRPMRSGEQNGIHYHFLTKEKALQLIWDGEFVETTEYNVASGDVWIYGTRFCDISTDKDQIIVINPEGYKKLKQVYNKNIIGIYIKPNFFTRIKRIIKRDKGNYLEAFRRYIADCRDFKGIEADIVIKDFEI